MADAKQTQKTHETFTVPNIDGDWDNAVYLDNQHSDNLMSAMLIFGGEFWAMKRRQMIVEKLLEEKKPVTRAAIDAYNPSAEELKSWDASRDEFIQRVFSVLTRKAETKAKS